MTSHNKNNTSAGAREGGEHDKAHRIDFSVTRTHSDNPVHVEEQMEHLSNIYIRSTQPQVQIESISDLLEAVKAQELDPCQDQTHSAYPYLAADHESLLSVSKKLPIKWPNMADNEAWDGFDERVSEELSPCLLSISSRVKLLEQTIYDVGANMFGHPPVANQSPSFITPKIKKVIELVKSKNSLLQQLESASSEAEILGLNAILNNVRSDLRILRRKCNKRKKRWRIKQARKKFNENPYKCGKELLNPKSKGELCVTQKVFDNHLKTLFADDLKEAPLPTLEGLPDPPVIKHYFNGKRFSEAEFQKVLQTRRNGSAPGANKIPYKVYKKCPSLSKFLFSIICAVQRTGNVPLQWRMAFSAYIPKIPDPDPKSISDFREIALLNVEGKIFFSLLSRRFFDHIVTKNKFINTSIQKGCMENVPGCWEHIAMVWDALKEARLEKRDVSTIWLDIANAYGSIPHQLIFFALRRYGISDNWIKIIQNYYQGLWSKSVSSSAPSSWHRHARGIFAGCTGSIILFLSGINVIIEYSIQVDFQGFITSSKTILPLIRAFMDDLNLMTTGVRESHILLDRVVFALRWARMYPRGSKSRSLVMESGRIRNQSIFSTLSVDSIPEKIPSIHQRPVRFLGRTVDSSLSDANRQEFIESKVDAALVTLDKSFHLGVNKVWILQFLLLQQVRWLLMIYEIPVSFAERLEQSVSKHIRKWMGLHPTITNLALYSKRSPCPLPITSISSLLKSAKVSCHLQLRDSQDPLISSSVPVLNTGRTWQVKDAVDDAESVLYFRKILGHTQVGKAGLGLIPQSKFPPPGTKEHRKLVSDTVFEEHDKDSVETSDNVLQTSWRHWCDYVRNDLSWKTIWATPARLLQFCIGSTFNTLPSPSNLARWKIAFDTSCTLCKAPICTTAHILSGCSFALNNGRYTFRHDTVLEAVLEALESQIKSKKSSKTPPKNIKFVREGQIGKRISKSYQGLLDLAKDWVILADIGETKLTFPLFITITLERPDIICYSLSVKHLLSIELTSPCEENMPERHSFKKDRYKELENQVLDAGWSANFFQIEVGARGYCANSVRSCFRKLGFPPKTIRSLLKVLGEKAMKSSFCIWAARDDPSWKPDVVSWSSSLAGSPTQPTKLLEPSRAGTHPASSQKPTLASKQLKSTSAVKQSSASQTCTPKHKTSNKLPIGLLNHGNTCYANSLLQALFFIPEIWSKIPSTFYSSSPFTKSFMLVMSFLRNNNTVFDPKFFLSQLGSLISKAKGNTFVVNKAQDAPEVLQHILNEILLCPTLPTNLINFSLVTTISCSQCQSSSTKEDMHSILQVVAASTIQQAIVQVQKTSMLEGDNMWDCPLCNEKKEAIRSTRFASLPTILIIHINRFTNILPSQFFKNTIDVACSSPLSIFEQVDDAAYVKRTYDLRAIVHHSGTIDNGHYTASVLDQKQNKWFKCNDKAVVPETSKTNKKTPYLLFYVKN